MKIKATKGERIFQVFNYLFLSFLSLICFYPLWHVLMASLSDSTALLSQKGLMWKPLGFDLTAYKTVLSNKNVLSGYWTTLKLLVCGISWQMMMTTLGAYVLSRRDFMLRRPLMLAITFTMFFSGGMIPTYLNIQQLGLKGTIWGVIIPFSINTYNMIILRTAFEGIPESLLEAARMDGAGHLTSLIKIVLPLSKATLSVITLYYGVAIWNSWFWAAQLIDEEKPIAVVLRDILIANNAGADVGVTSTEGMKYALIIVATVPILCIYPFIQKYFTQGVMIGAVKE